MDAGGVYPPATSAMKKGKIVSAVVFGIMAVMLVGFLAKLTGGFKDFKLDSLNEAAARIFNL